MSSCDTSTHIQIIEVESCLIKLPRESPLSFSNRTLTYQDHAITSVRTDTSHEGIGYSLGDKGAGLIVDAAESVLEPLLVSEDPHDTERLWHEMYGDNVQIGRTGLFLRVLSTVDIALWDVKGGPQRCGTISTRAMTS